MYMTVSIRLDDGQVVSSSCPLNALTDDAVSLVAHGLVLEAQEEAFMVLGEGE